MAKPNNHPSRDLMIFCRKCNAYVWHNVINPMWAKCLGCGDMADLSDPGTIVEEVNNRGKSEKRI